MSESPNIDGIIALSPDRWGDVRRPRQLMQELARIVPVLYLESPLALASLAKSPGQLKSRETRSAWRRALLGRCEPVAEDMSLATPLTLLPEHVIARLPWTPLRSRMRKLGRRGIARRAERLARRLGMSSPAVWYGGHPVSPSELHVRTAAFTVYDCIDRWSAFPTSASNSRLRDQETADEQELFRRADAVFCSARGLLDSARETAAEKPTLLRNAADVEHFARAQRPVPADLSELPRPLIGYVGAIAEWVDLELIRDVALARPDWSFALIGPVFTGQITGDSRGLSAVQNLPNVDVLGPRPYDELPAYLESFDVAVIPFKVNPLTADTDPIKVYEYLAAGLPVVSTPLPEVTALGVVRIAATAEDFVREIEAALSDEGAEDAVARHVSVAEQNSWRSRAEAAWAALSSAAASAPHDAGGAPKRPRVLVVGSGLPWPLDHGYSIRQFENIRALATFADVTLISYIESETAAADLAGLRAALPEVRVLDPVPLAIHIKEHPLLVAKAELAGLLTGRPYKVSKFMSAEMKHRVAQLVCTEAFEVLHVDLAVSDYAHRACVGDKRPRVVLDTQNVEYELLMDHWRRGEFGLLGPAVRLETLRTRRYESKACAAADLVLAISDGDREILQRMGGSRARVVTLPPVIERRSVERPGRPKGEDTVLFVGLLSWLPNREAANWLCDELVPQLRRMGCKARVQVVGKGASEALIGKMRDAGIEALGYVKDLAAVYASASVFVAPLLTGGGVRIKLLEAMCEGVPIVTTTTGAKGLGVQNGEELLIADTPEAFAEAVVAVLADTALAERLVRSAMEYVGTRHSGQAAAEVLKRAYESAMQGS